MESVNPLFVSIIKTILYFDIVHFPVTREELFRYLWQPPAITYEEFLPLLDLCVREKMVPISEKWGYYFLDGHEKYIDERRRAVVPSDRKLFKARRAARLISWLPGIISIFLCNSVASETAHEDSDIDFFIITSKNRVWIARFFSNIVLLCFGVRRHGKKIANRICLSFYIDEEHMDMGGLRLIDDDVHFIYWLKQMMVLYDPKNYYQKFMKANSWTDKFVPHMNFLMIGNGCWKVKSKNFVQSKKEGLTFFIKKCSDRLEQFFYKIQLVKMSRSGKNKKENNDRGVIIQLGIIKLHEKDTRRWYREEWLRQCREIFTK